MQEPYMYTASQLELECQQKLFFYLMSNPVQLQLDITALLEFWEINKV